MRLSAPLPSLRAARLAALLTHPSCTGSPAAQLLLGAEMAATVYTDWGSVLADLDPFVFAFIGAGLAIGLSVLGAAWGIFITGSSLLGAAVRAPRIRSKNLIRWAAAQTPSLPPQQSLGHMALCTRRVRTRPAWGGRRHHHHHRGRTLPSRSRRPTARRMRCRSVIFCEAVAIYGVIVSIILQTKMEKPDLTKESTFVDAKIYNIASGYALFWAGICCGVGNLACGCVPPAPRSCAGGALPWPRQQATAPAGSALPCTEPAPSRRAQGVRRHLR